MDNDDSCLTLAISGCTNSDYLEYISTANVDDGSCTTFVVHGCTSSNYLEYDVNANVDDNSCATLVVLGCNNENAENFNPNANSNDGSCEYDLIPADCRISFETLNTGTNHTIMVPGTATEQLNLGDLIGVFYISDNGSTVCAGSEEWTGANMQIVAYGDDTTTPEVDGLTPGNPFLFLAKSNNDLFIVDASFQSPNMSAYEVNGLSFIASMNFEHSCTEEKLGCTDHVACNYDASANTNDNSCNYPDDFYLCSGGCVNDVDNDSVCDELEVEGCMDDSASNFNADATDDNSSCISWENAYQNCLNSGGDDGVTQSDVDAVQALLDEANTDLATALANQGEDDGVTQADVDAVQALLNVANANLENALASQEDGVTQADVDAAVAAVDITTDNQAVADAAYADGAASVTPEDGVSQADVDAAVAAVDITTDNQAVADAAYADGAASVTPEDGVSQADVDAVQAQLDAALANGGGGSCDPIHVDIVAGWNILGYTLSYGQDVAATVADIVGNIEIVKNNDAKVYWPEFSFNGIGDFVPGQGYQVKTTAAISNYTWPDVSGQRIEMTPTVPAWAIEMEAELHPNDIRSLVKVVNMLGQEVNPKDQFSGEVLLHLYNDGTVEKRIVK